MSARALAGFAVVGCLVVACGGRVGGLSGGGGGSSSGGSSSGAASSGGSSSGGASSGAGGSSSGVSTGTCVYIDQTTLDVSCNSASDCFPLQAGNVCDGNCVCGDYAANVSEQASYEAAIQSIQLADCFCPAVPIACENHQCVVQQAEVDAGPPDDASACVDIDLSTYDRSCTVDSDCIGITGGVVCSGQCACGGSTINKSGQARYQAQIDSIQPGDCPCVAAFPPSCVSGVCTICGGGPNQPPGCPDAG